MLLTMVEVIATSDLHFDKNSISMTIIFRPFSYAYRVQDCMCTSIVKRRK